MRFGLKTFQIGSLFFCALLYVSCGGDDWRDPLGISQAGDGSELNRDGTPYFEPEPGDPGLLALSDTTLLGVVMKENTGPFKTPIVLKNEGVSDLAITITTSGTWLTVSGIEDGFVLSPLDTVIAWISLTAGTSSDEGTVSFDWTSEDTIATEAFGVSMTVGSLSAWDEIYIDIFDKKCSCHNTSSGAGELLMNKKDVAYDQLVTFVAQQVPDLKRVEPWYPK